MLVELAINDLGIIEASSLVFGPGMTALTGETGAGKTMVVEAIDLLMGGRAEGHMVRRGATEAVVEGRFVVGDEEHVLRRVVPKVGRSRAYLDGRLATVGALGEMGATLVDLHGQHAHQSLLSVAVQRGALDRFGAVPVGELTEAKAAVAALDAALADLGGDARARAREIDLYRYQVAELEQAGLSGPDEDDELDREEDELADAAAHREAAAVAFESLSTEAGAGDAVGRAVAMLDGRSPFSDLHPRLASVAAELADLAGALRDRVEQIDEDPERLGEVRARRQLLSELRRKYGASLADVIAYQAEATERLDELESFDARAADLDARRNDALAELATVQSRIKNARQGAAPALATAVHAHLGELAMPKARLTVEVHGPAGEDVQVLMAANPGSDLLPLSKVASGGELARTMLALRLVLTAGPPTLVFDEVDAGIGGSAALAVGRSLGALGATHQVLVVTHLPQVAAFADHHVLVAKHDDGERTSSEATLLGDRERVTELSRMLSGSETTVARKHARELLASAKSARG